MTDEQQTKESRRKKRPAIGGISQYATIGSKRGPGEHQDAEHSDVQTLERADVQDTRRSDALTTEHRDSQASSTSDAQQKSKPDRNRQTVYLEPDLDDWIRERIIRERKRLGHRVEISDIVNEAVRLYKSSINNP